MSWTFYMVSNWKILKRDKFGDVFERGRGHRERNTLRTQSYSEFQKIGITITHIWPNNACLFDLHVMPFKENFCIHTNKCLYLFDFTCANAKHLQCPYAIHTQDMLCGVVKNTIYLCMYKYMQAYVKGVTSIDFFTPFTTIIIILQFELQTFGHIGFSSSPINNFGLFFWYCDFSIFKMHNARK